MTTLLDATLTRLGGTAARTYALNATPESPTYPYRVVSVAPADSYAYAHGGAHARMQRITIQSFSRTMAGAQDFDDTATTLLDGYFLTATGYKCGACRLELGAAVGRDPDDNGVVGLTTTLKFSANKEA